MDKQQEAGEYAAYDVDSYIWMILEHMSLLPPNGASCRILYRSKGALKSAKSFIPRNANPLKCL